MPPRKRGPDPDAALLDEALHQVLRVHDALWRMAAVLIMRRTAVSGGSDDDWHVALQQHFEHERLLATVALRNFKERTLPTQAATRYALGKDAELSRTRVSRAVSAVAGAGDIDTGLVARQQRIVNAIVGAAEDISLGLMRVGPPISIMGSDHRNFPNQKSVPMMSMDSSDDVARAALHMRMFAVAEEDFELWTLVHAGTSREDALAALVAAVRSRGTRTHRTDKERADLRNDLNTKSRRATTKGQRLPAAWQVFRLGLRGAVGGPTSRTAVVGRSG